MGDLNHLYCSRCSPGVVQGYWFSLCGEFVTVPRRLATCSSWDSQCVDCGKRVGGHDRIECQLRPLGFVFESEMTTAIDSEPYV